MFFYISSHLPIWINTHCPLWQFSICLTCCKNGALFNGVQLFFSIFFLCFLLCLFSICCSGPFSPQGSLKLHLVTSTPTLTFLPLLPRLIFLQTLPEVFLPRGSSFLRMSPLWCKPFVLGTKKAVQPMAGEDGWETYNDTQMQMFPLEKTLFQLFTLCFWTHMISATNRF